MVAKPNRRDLVPSKDPKGWDVTKPGAKDPVWHHQTQADAEQAAKGELRGKASGRLQYHRPDGTIRDKDTMRAGEGSEPAEGQEAPNLERRLRRLPEGARAELRVLT